MKEEKTYIAEDGKKFLGSGSAEACRKYEVVKGFVGSINDYLNEKGHKEGAGRSMRRNAIAGYVAWEDEHKEEKEKE